MTFTNPAILMALAALAIPPIVHLLGRRKARRVVLPTARFAHGAHAATRGRARLRRLALLGLRLAAVALLVLAVAEPRFGAAGPQRAPGGPWIVCLDTTPSMDARDRPTARRDLARQALLALLAGADRHDPAVLARSGGPAERTAVGRLRERLRQTPPTDWTCEPLGTLLERAVAACPRRQPVPKGADRDAAPAGPQLPRGTRLLVATDATPWAVRDLEAGRFRRLDADVSLVPVGGEVANAWIDLPRVSVIEVDGERRLSVEADVAGRSPGESERVTCAVVQAELARQIGTGPGLGRARFVMPLRGDGPWQGWLRLGEPDALAADDTRFFVAAAAPAGRRVLVVDAAAGREEAVTSAAMVRAAFPDGVPASRFRATLVRASQVDAAALEGVRLVFWVGPEAPADPAAPAAFVSGGGGLVWVPAAPGPPAEPLARVLGVSFGGVDRPTEGVTIDPAGHGSGLLGAFEGGTSGDVSRPVFRQRLRMTLHDSGGETVRFLDGRAAIFSREQGRGRTVALSVGPGRVWGDLGVRPEFVVLVHSLAESLLPGTEPAVVLGREGPPQVPPFARQPGHVLPPSPPSGPPRRHVAVNLAPEETADLAPQVERLKAVFDPDRVRAVNPAQLLSDKGLTIGMDREYGPGPPAATTGGLTGWLVAALLVVLAAELALASRQAAAAAPSVAAQ